MTHALKTLPYYFGKLISGEKTFEIRKDDRPFEVGDKLILQEWDEINKEYTGEEVVRVILMIVRDEPKMGLKPGYCIMSIINN